MALIKKLIIATDGAEEKNCDLATKKFLTTEMNDIKKAVRFYEKEAVEIDIKKVTKRVSLREFDEETRKMKISKEKAIRR